jgi:hypothetical protein
VYGVAFQDINAAAGELLGPLARTAAAAAAVAGATALRGQPLNRHCMLTACTQVAMQMVLSCTAVISSLVTQSTAAFHLCSLIAAGISNGSFGRLAAVHALLHAYQALIQGFTLSLLMVAVT